MNAKVLIALGVLVAVALAQYDDSGVEKRAMRNALVRFGRSGGGMRNALVRFGKRSDPGEDAFETPNWQDKRNGAPQPFVRFGRSAGRIDHMHDILNTLEAINADAGH